MLKKSFQQYINNFRGFSRNLDTYIITLSIGREQWFCLFSKYLKKILFTYGSGLDNGGFGFGSMLGSWLGGKLSDKIGFYKVMVFSLFTSGIFFFALQYITTLGIVYRDV
jgi:MFS family permease